MRMTADGFVQRNDQTYSGGWDVGSVSESQHGKMVGVPENPAGNKHHNTYLHAKPIIGWPADHSAEDTFDVPPILQPLRGALPGMQQAGAYPPCAPNPIQKSLVDAPEYKAEFGADGSARVALVTKKHIGTFDTYADAVLAATALNEHKGL